MVWRPPLVSGATRHLLGPALDSTRQALTLQAAGGTCPRGSSWRVTRSLGHVSTPQGQVCEAVRLQDGCHLSLADLREPQWTPSSGDLHLPCPLTPKSSASRWLAHQGQMEGHLQKGFILHRKRRKY